MSNPRGYGEMTCNQTRDTLIRFKNHSNDGNDISNSGTIHFKYFLCEKIFLGRFISEFNLFKSKEILHRRNPRFLEAVPVFETACLWVHRSLLNTFGNVLDYLFSKIIFNVSEKQFFYANKPLILQQIACRSIPL